MNPLAQDLRPAVLEAGAVLAASAQAAGLQLIEAVPEKVVCLLLRLRLPRA
jgi:hypothetical protein